MTGERVLLLDGQTTQALACARSFGRAGSSVLVASTRTRPLAGWSRFCVERVRLSGETLSAFAALRMRAQALAVTLVMPLTERSMLLLNADREAWERAGITIGCAPAAALDAALDKARTIDTARACGVAVPATREPTSMAECFAAVREVGLPCVVKARFSSVWYGARLLRDGGASYVRRIEELEDAVRRHRQGSFWPIIQAFVPGRGKGVFTVCDRGRPLAWFAHERVRDVRPTGSGSSVRRAAPLDPRLREPAERLLAAMRWHGPAMVEFRDPGEGAPWLMEVNGRFWGSLQLAVSAGVDFPRMWLGVLRGETPSPPSGFREGVTLRWLWGDAKRLMYVMAGPPPGFPGLYPTRWQGLREVLGRQPAGTHSETWDRDDPWPAVGEWVQGFGEILERRSGARPKGQSAIA